MTTEVKLPNDAVAILRTGEELTNKQVKELRRAARAVGLVGQRLQDLGMDELREDQKAQEAEENPEATAELNRRALRVFSQLSDEDDDKLDYFQRVATVVRLVSWTVKNPDDTDRALPTTAAEVDDLPRPIYAVLITEAAKLDLNEDFSLDGATSPKAITDVSEDSALPSEGVPS